MDDGNKFSSDILQKKTSGQSSLDVKRIEKIM